MLKPEHVQKILADLDEHLAIVVAAIAQSPQHPRVAGWQTARTRLAGARKAMRFEAANLALEEAQAAAGDLNTRIAALQTIVADGV